MTQGRRLGWTSVPPGGTISKVALEISLLGPVEAKRDGSTVDLGPPQQRALLALLALRAGAVVRLDAIVDALWPEKPPASAEKIVQTYVSRLRRTLGSETIARRGRGYAMTVSDSTVDIARFEELAARGELQAALELWRGPALADVAGTPALEHEADRLEELRLQVHEEHLDAEIAAGNYTQVIPELHALVAEHPLRERPVAQLMTALYGCGRQADALQTYRRARSKLVAELGIEPGPGLRELERRILEQDPDLAPLAAERDAEGRSHSTRPPKGGSRARVDGRGGLRRHRTRIVAAIGLVALIAAVAALVVSRGERTPVAVMPNSIVRIDPKTNEVVDSIPVGRAPAGLVATDDAVWVANARDRTLSRVDTRAGAVETIGGLPAVELLTRDERGNVYASAWDYPFVWRIEPEKVEIVRRFRVRSRAVGLAVGGGSLWVVDRLVNSVTRIDLGRGTVASSVKVGADPLAASFGFGSLWVANSDDDTVSVLLPGTDTVETVPVDSRPFGIAAGEGGVWVGGNTSATVTRIDPDTRRVLKRIDTGTASFGLFSVAAGAGGVWASNWFDSSVVRIDPRTNAVVAIIRLAASPRDIAVAGDEVWVSVVEPGSDY